VRALVLSGGGAKGAYQVGALQHLVGELQIKYDAYCGTSVGAINAAHLAQYGAGEEFLGAATLTKLWEALETKRVYRKWYHGLLWLLPALWRPSIYSTQPLRDMLKAGIDPLKLRGSGKKLRVGAINLNTMGRYVWTEDSPVIHQAIEASASMPVFFEPVHLQGAIWTDGGLREGTPLQDALSMGATEIDVIVVDQEAPEGAFTGTPTALDVASRTVDTMLHEITLWDLKGAALYNQLAAAGLSSKRLVTIRVLRPSRPVGDARNFSSANNKAAMKQGYEDAKAMKW